MGRDDIDLSIRRYVDSPAIARDYDRYFAGHPLLAYDMEFVLEWVVPGATVLDCGAGTGRHVLPLARRGCRVVGVDLSTEMIRVMRRKLAPERFFARLVQADLLALPFRPDARFEAALLMFSTLGMIHPAANRLRLLQTLRAHLDDRGVVLLHVHNNNYRYSPHRVGLRPLKARIQRLAGRMEPGDHIIENYRGAVDLRLHSFALAELTALLRDAGLAPLHVEGLNDARNGPCPTDDIDRDANGFFVAARRTD
jgi:SAM-dependent methyltransferase